MERLLEVGLCVSFAVFFAFSRTLADNRLPPGKRRTRLQRQDLFLLVLSNCAMAAPGGLLAIPLGSMMTAANIQGELNLALQLAVSATVGWDGLAPTMKILENLIGRRFNLYGTNAELGRERPCDRDGEPGPGGADGVQKEQ